MDPNNNQPVESSPIPQATPQPVATPVQPVAPPPVQPTPAVPEPVSEAPKKSNKKWLILLLILILLAAGITAYFLFAKSQMDNAQKEAIDNTTTALPTPTLVPTLTPEEDLEVASPEADLIDIEVDVKGL